MNIQLETIRYTKNRSSFHFFKREALVFPSYRHYHPELELTYIEQGTGIRYVGDNISSYKAGDLVLLGKNLPHDYVSYRSSQSTPSIAFVFQFPETILQNMVEGQLLSALFLKAKQGIYFPNPKIGLIEKIKSISTTPSFGNLIDFLQILNELQKHPRRELISSIAFSPKNENQKSKNRISVITEYISKHYDQAISIEQMAKLSKMAPPSFCRWFKQKTGCSFVTYLNATRIEKACQLLFQTENNIAHIGFQTGFDTVSHFNRTFKKIKKITPKEYRKKLTQR